MRRRNRPTDSPLLHAPTLAVSVRETVDAAEVEREDIVATRGGYTKNRIFRVLEEVLVVSPKKPIPAARSMLVDIKPPKITS